MEWKKMNPNTNEDFGSNLKNLRRQKGLTQQDMANTINTSRSCVSNYESGNRQPDSVTIMLIADYFDVSIDYLLGRSPVKTVFKSEDTLYKLQSILSQLNTTKFLDVSKSSYRIKCAITEFYVYLLKKEAK